MHKDTVMVVKNYLTSTLEAVLNKEIKGLRLLIVLSYIFIKFKIVFVK